MPKTQNKNTETDSVYFLKIILFLLLGSFWLRLTNVHLGPFTTLNVPVGLLVGLLFAQHEHFQIDRKVEYAILLVATVASFYLPTGIVL